MNQDNAINIANVITNTRYCQNDDYYNLFLRATEIDLESIKVALRTGTIIDLISPSLKEILNEKANQDF